MKKSLKYRETLTDVRRVVVKIGTRVIARATGRPDMRYMRQLVDEIAAVHKRGVEVAVVTSGAVGAGMEALGMKTRPTAVPDLQMCAAVGQAKLMACYDELFSRRGCKVGQILLTHDDFHHKIRLMNARRTMENLFRHKVIPIINENDVVADEEIKADLTLGDNDLLASLVVKLIRADLAILLTTVDGVLDFAAGKGQRIRYIEHMTESTFSVATGSKNAISKGGMDSKLRAAHSASKAGCSVVIANGRMERVLTRIMKAEDVGTLILASAL